MIDITMDIMTGPAGWVMAVFTGLILGSFASAVTYRIPRGISWVSARSACPSCRHALSIPDLVPFFSWAFLRGKCRHCRTKIGWRYPLIELSTLVLCLVAYGVYGFGLAGVAVMVAMPFFIALLAIDLEHLVLPDQLNIITGFAGLVYAFASGPDDSFMAVLSALLAGGGYAFLVYIIGRVMSRILGRDSLGFGDVKFFAVAGIWLGFSFLPVFLVLSGLCGVLSGAGWRVFLKQDRFPFGPALIVSLILCILFYTQIQGVLLEIY